MKLTISLITTILLLSSTCLSQSLTTPVKPFVNQSTLLLARVNVATVDFNSLDRWADDLMNQLAPADRKDDISRQVHAAVDSARQWSQSFTKAGGKTAWAVLSLDDLSRNSPFFFIVPIEGGADVQALKTSLAIRNATVEQIGSVLVVAEDGEIPARLKNAKAEERPDLVKAIDAADPSSDLIVAAAVSADGRR